MAKPLFSKADLAIKVPKRMITKATIDIGRILTIKARVLSSPNIEDRLRRAINKATSRIALDLKQALDDALRSNVWPAVSGDQDIYDTGQLLESGKVLITENGIEVVYDAPYATLIRYGGYISPYGNQSIRVYLPPRPWVDAVISGGGPVPRFDFAKYYNEAIIEEFS